MLKSRDMHTNYTLVIQFKGNKSNSGREKNRRIRKNVFILSTTAKKSVISFSKKNATTLRLFS